MNKQWKAVFRHWGQLLKRAHYFKIYPSNINSSNCALCKEYVEHVCLGCPVRKVTGLPNCKGSPWYELYDEIYDSLDGKPLSGERRKVIATLVKKEFLFLKSVYKSQTSKKEDQNVLQHA